MHFLKPCLLLRWLFISGILFWAQGTSLAVAQPSCQLYSGEKSPEALHQREAALKNDATDHCEMANIYYQLARQSADLRSPDRQTYYLNLCIESADQAIQLDSRAGAAYFLKGLCQGRKGEASGIWSSLKVIEPFRKNMETAVQVAPGIDRGGPHRALGRLYYKLPFFLGGNLEKSTRHLQQAIKYGPEYWENHFYLAQSYYSLARYDEAKAALAAAMKVSAQDPDQSDAPERQQSFENLMDSIDEECENIECSMN